MTENPNIFLLTINVLRADQLGYHRYDRDTSPFHDSLVDQTICSMSASSQVHPHARRSQRCSRVDTQICSRPTASNERDERLEALGYNDRRN
jgi:hypothetical protein